MNKSSQSGFHVSIILITVAVIGLIGVLVWKFLDASGVNLAGKIAGNNFASGYNCKERDVKFTSPPLHMKDLGYIRPLGAMLDGHVTPTDHVYVGPVKRDVPDNTYPVLMPADGTVVEVGKMPAEYIGDRKFSGLAKEDHRVVVSFSCRYFSIFIHVHKLAGEVAKQAASLQPSENKQMSVNLKAGDTIGYIGGDTFDWTPLDVESKLSGFIHPDYYKRESWKINTISPFDLYTGDLKAQMEAKSWRTVAPIGGKIDYDQPGKLIGTWFREGTNGYEGANQERYWDGHLSVVPDYIDPSYSIVSIGNWQDKATQFVVNGMPNLAKISSANSMVKMELRPIAYTSDDPSWRGEGVAAGIHPSFDHPVAGTIAFQVLSGEKLKVEKFVGKTVNQVTGFTSAAQTYER
jgi:hypothetical protein